MGFLPRNIKTDLIYEIALIIYCNPKLNKRQKLSNRYRNIGIIKWPIQIKMPQCH